MKSPTVETLDNSFTNELEDSYCFNKDDNEPFSAEIHNLLRSDDSQDVKLYNNLAKLAVQ